MTRSVAWTRSGASASAETSPQDAAFLSPHHQVSAKACSSLILLLRRNQKHAES